MMLATCRFRGLLFAAAVAVLSALAVVPPVSAQGAPDLVLTKDDGGVFAVEGEVIAYESHYVNAGTADASGVEVVETVPEHTTFDAAGSTERWTCPDGSPPGTVCRFADGTLEPGDSGRARFAVRVDAEVPLDVVAIENTVTVSDDGSHGPDPTPGDNAASDTTPFHRPDLVVTKDDGGIEAAPGDVVAYEIHYVNAGTADASGVEVTETVPDFTTFDAGRSTGGWSCPDGSPAGTACVFADGTLEPGDSGRARFVVALDSSIPPGVTEIVNTVTVTDDGSHRPDLDPRDNTATDTTPIVGGGGGPDLAVTKGDGGVSAEPGDVVVYQIGYANLGPADASGVELTEMVPEHSTFEPGASSPGWGCIGLVPPEAGLKPERVQRSPAGVSCLLAIGDLDAGDGGSVDFAVRVADPVPGGVTEIVNVVSITDNGANGPDVDPRNNSSTETTPIASGPGPGPGNGLDATAIDTPLGGTPASAGDEVAYTVIVVNDGPDEVLGVELEGLAPLHTQLRVGTVTATQGLILSGNQPGDESVLVDFGELAAGAEAVVTFEVEIDPELPPGLDEIAFQGTVRAAGGVALPTDDPDTAEPDDPTRTPVEAGGGGTPAEIPVLSLLGLLALAAVLAAVAVFRLRIWW